MKDRQKEVKEVLDRADTYEFVVRFTRSLSSDLDCGGKSIKGKAKLADALRKQFVEELQAAYDDSGMAGHFEVVAGPCLRLSGE